MLDHLRADHTIEGTVLERQCERGGVDQRHPMAAEEAKLAEVGIEADRVVEALHDEAGTASGIEDAAASTCPGNGDMVAAAMPESLHWNRAVKGALVVVRRC